MPRSRGYWKERSRKRRENPEYCEQQKQWFKDWYIRNKDDPQRKARKAAQMRVYTKDPNLRERHMARWILNRRVATGQIIKQPCHCGETKVQGHHHDYASPLNVIWLCRQHHQEEHAKTTP